MDDNDYLLSSFSLVQKGERLNLMTFTERGRLNMVFHLFFITITIKKRVYTGAELEQAHKSELNVRLVEEEKQRHLNKTNYRVI